MKGEAEVREAIQANRSLMREGLAVAACARALRTLETRLSRAGLPPEPYWATPCRLHRWVTPELRCLACGSDCEAKAPTDYAGDVDRDARATGGTWQSEERARIEREEETGRR